MEQLELKDRRWSKKKVTLPATHFAGTLLVVALIGFWAGDEFGTPFSTTPIYDTRAPEAVDLAPLFAAWNLLDKNFAPATTTEPITAQDKLWGAIQGLAAAYGDDYTVFFPPVEKKIFDTQVEGAFQGVGMEIGKRGGVLTVVAPIKDTPAFRAGIKTGDLILKIDGESTLNLAVDEAVNKIRGPKGTTVVLTLSREDKDEGKEFEVPVTRDSITLPTLDASLRKDGVFVVALYSFNAQSPQLFADAMADYQRSGGDKLVVDLRGNPGGYLEAAVDMASWLLPQGATIVVEDYAGKQPQDVFRSRGFGSLTTHGKVVVLIDGGSASAAEIFAGALHDHKRATLVGEASFGKGSVQQLFDVTDDTSLKITIARWLTPNGTSISHEGIQPDIAVERTSEDVAAERDPQLERAVQFLLTGK